MSASIWGEKVMLEIPYYKAYELSDVVYIDTSRGHEKAIWSYSHTKEGNSQLLVVFGGG